MFKYIFALFIFSIISNMFSQDNFKQTPKEKMETLTKKAEAKWRYNPFRKSETELKFVGWQDPYANITRFWIGTSFNAHNMYPNPNFNIDDVSLYFTPTIATELSAIAFEVG